MKTSHYWATVAFVCLSASLPVLVSNAASPGSIPLTGPTPAPVTLSGASATSSIEEATPSATDLSVDSTFLDGVRQGMDVLAGVQADVSETPSIGDNLGGALDTGAILRTFGWLAFIIVLLFIVAAILKKWLGHRLGTPGHALQLVSSMAVSPKSKVHIVEADGQRFLIGEGNNQLTRIADLGPAQHAPEPEYDEAIPETAPQGFSSRIQAWQQSLSGQTSSRELRTSLQLIDGLTRRLRSRKHGGGMAAQGIEKEEGVEGGAS